MRCMDEHLKLPLSDTFPGEPDLQTNEWWSQTPDRLDWSSNSLGTHRNHGVALKALVHASYSERIPAGHEARLMCSFCATSSNSSLIRSASRGARVLGATWTNTALCVMLVHSCLERKYSRAHTGQLRFAHRSSIPLCEMRPTYLLDRSLISDRSIDIRQIHVKRHYGTCSSKWSLSRFGKCSIMRTTMAAWGMLAYKWCST
jgi:hypothetical protein